MEITETLYVTTRNEWRKWLQKNHAKKKEIWLIYYKKNSGKKRIPYVDAVKEALCFGWIDSTVKGIDDEKYAQRFSPRKKGSPISPLNLELIKKLLDEGKMTPAGMIYLTGNKDVSNEDAHEELKKKHEKLVIPKDVEKALKKDPEVWKNFQAFPENYKRIRIGWLDVRTPTRMDVYTQRLNYLIKMTKKNKRFGTIRE
ncbi:MAG: hypothetical protein FJY86_02025 [Candidatus Diapherotrites archaeon]|uniref:YdeI/OmpD-associated family protein n=1 Tax=Candidatus Iainarchaeum sp. TaxID=3101447 RepID=A0A8T4C726_9ARCH|nr:hypothetical protein [Candidatus Diapherotrites archaeon]